MLRLYQLSRHRQLLSYSRFSFSSILFINDTFSASAEILFGSILLNLSNGSPYNVYLYAPSFCPGYINGYCWVLAPSLPSNQQDCCDICANYGDLRLEGKVIVRRAFSPVQFQYYNNYDDANCTNEAELMGSPSCCIRIISLAPPFLQ